MAGRTIEETARIVHSSKSSVVAVKKTLGTKLHHLQRGRKPILTYREIEDLKIQCMSDKCLVAADCITYCWDIFGKKVSRTTVMNCLKAVGVTSRVSKKKPLISSANRKKRISFAKSHIDYNFSNVIVADEVPISTRTLLAPRRHLGTEETRNRVVIGKMSNVSASIWACFSRDGPGPISVFSGALTAKRYQAMLKENFVDYYNALDNFDKNISYLHDNASIHKAESTMRFFEEKGIILIPIPPYSPDLNPIENVWKYLKEMIFRNTSNFPNIAEITVAAKAAWANLPVELCRTLMDSMNNRCHLIIQKRGAITRY